MSFDMLKRLLSEFGCEIVVINDTDDKTDETYILEENNIHASLFLHDDVFSKEKSEIGTNK